MSKKLKHCDLQYINSTFNMLGDNVYNIIKFIIMKITKIKDSYPVLLAINRHIGYISCQSWYLYLYLYYMFWLREIFYVHIVFMYKRVGVIPLMSIVYFEKVLTFERYGRLWSNGQKHMFRCTWSAFDFRGQLTDFLC